MAGNLTETAKHIRENTARVKGYTRRDEPLRALDILAETLLVYAQHKFMGNTRFELEVNLDEALSEISRLPAVHALLPMGPHNQTITLRYIKNKEKVLAAALQSFAATLRAQAEEGEQARLQEIENYRKQLLSSGQQYLNKGDYVRARVFFGRVADEFGKIPGLLANLGTRYKDKELYVEAADMFQRAVDMFPKEVSNYSALIECHLAMHEFEKVQRIYVLVLRQFGTHPRTLYNMARFYLVWRKKDLAAEAAYRALQIDPEFLDARILLEKLDGHL